MPTAHMPCNSILKTLVLPREMHAEIPRLPRTSIENANSNKLNMRPLSEESRCVHCTVAPEPKFHQRKGSPQTQGKHLHRCILSATDMHPHFQRILPLLRLICHSPLPIQIVQKRFDTSARGIDFHHVPHRRICFGRKNQEWVRQCAVVLMHLAPDRQSRNAPHLYALHRAIQPRIQLLGRQRVAQHRIDSLTVFAFGVARLWFGFQREIQDRISAHFSNYLSTLFEYGQESNSCALTQHQSARAPQ